jgi:uncharacterized membrane protein YgdD (TMEM256/DUF423 family)
MTGKQSEARPLLAAGALLASIGVALGAFGAHGLKATLGAAELGWWETAVQYQMWHALALVALGCRRSAPARPPGCSQGASSFSRARST